MNNKIILSGIAVTVFMISGCGKNSSETAGTFESEEMVEDINTSLGNEAVLIPQATDEQAQDNTAMASDALAAVPEALGTAVTEPGSFVKPTNQEVQQSLKNAGLYTGQVDGVVGPRTKKAIRDFQDQNSLNADGRVGPQTWAKLEPYLHQAQVQDVAPVSTPDADN